MVAQKDHTKCIEGPLYLDHSPVRIEIANGKISNIIRIKELPEKRGNIYIAPGFIDNQVNGYSGVSFDENGLTLKGVEKATKALWQAGVTTYLPTVTTSERTTLLKSFSVLAQAKKRYGFLWLYSRLPFGRAFYLTGRCIPFFFRGEGGALRPTKAGFLEVSISLE